MAFASCPLTYQSTVVVVCTDSLTASSSPTQRRRRRSSAPCRRRRRENLSCCCCLVLLKYKKAPVLHTVLLLLAAAVGQYMQSPASSARTLRPRTSSCTTTTTTWSFWPLLCVRGLANLRQHKKKKKTKQSNRRILLIARRALDTALYTACQYILLLLSWLLLEGGTLHTTDTYSVPQQYTETWIYRYMYQSVQLLSKAYPDHQRRTVHYILYYQRLRVCGGIYIVNSSYLYWQFNSNLRIRQKAFVAKKLRLRRLEELVVFYEGLSSQLVVVPLLGNNLAKKTSQNQIWNHSKVSNNINSNFSRLCIFFVKLFIIEIFP